MLSGCASVASRGADIAILSLTRLLLKVRLPVITGADADWASQFAEMRLVFRRSRTLLTSILLACVRVVVAPTAGWCDDTLKVAVGAPNNWDSGLPDVGQRAGIFAKHRLRLEILYTNGGGETMQAVISGSADIGIAAGTAGVFGAFAKGAPVRILLAGTTGASDLYWYVPAGSQLKSFPDLEGKTVGYSTNGASTHTTLLALIKYFKVAAKTHRNRRGGK